jgi:hypothetical protein
MGVNGVGGNKSAIGTAPQQAPEDPNVKELREKVAKLVDEKFGGDYQAAFDHYNKNRDTGIDHGELMDLLGDADIGNFITRGFWADGVLDFLDKKAGDKDGRVQWSEFQDNVALPSLAGGLKKPGK